MKKNKEIKIFLILLFMAMLIIVFFSIKTLCLKNEEEIIEEEKIASTISENEKSVLIVNLTQTEESNQIIGKQSEVKSTKSKENETYTAKNGKKYNSIGTINIPSLNIKYPILSKTSEELLKVSLTKFWGGNPNEVGNLCIIGHNYKNSKFFGNLLKIKNGDIVKITDLGGNTLDYKVYDTYVVDPEDTACTSQLTNGNIEVTLITCYYENGNVHATKRFIVKARVE